MEDVTFYLTKENSWHQESFKDIITYFSIGPNGEGKMKRVGEREAVSWKRAERLISNEWEPIPPWMQKIKLEPLQL